MNTKEEMEMKVFDLLEGNLSKEEAKAVEALIQRDPHWAREYRLMQLTYLQEAEGEKPVYPNPEKLYRTAATWTLFPRRAYYGSAAAAVALLAIGFWLREPAPASRLAIASESLPAQSVPAPEGRSAAAARSAKVQKLQARSLKPAPMPVYEPPRDCIVPLQSDMDEDALLAVAEPVPSSLEPRSVRTLPLPVQQLQLASPQSVRFIDGKYIPVNQRKSLYFRLMNQGREMLAYVTDPSIRFERLPREGRIDRLRLRIETQRIGIIATLIE
jgi:hypothetical protein